MEKPQIPKCQTRQSNKDRPRRRSYRLTKSGLASLRQSAGKTKPWQWSTGPRTTAGKARSRSNARKHGERGADAIAAWRQLNGALRLLRAHDRLEAASTADVDAVTCWTQRIALELDDAGEMILHDSRVGRP